MVRAKWASSKDVDLVFADEMYMVEIGDSFHLTFGQKRTNTMPSEPGEDPDAEIRPVSTVVLPASTVRRIAKVLQQRVQREQDDE
jgi:hypothetical protein